MLIKPSEFTIPPPPIHAGEAKRRLAGWFAEIAIVVAVIVLVASRTSSSRG